MSSSQLFEISKDLSYSFSLFVVWTNLLQNKTEVPVLLQLRVIGQRAGIKVFSIMVEKVILKNAGILLIINTHHRFSISHLLYISQVPR